MSWLSSGGGCGVIHGVFKSLLLPEELKAPQTDTPLSFLQFSEGCWEVELAIASECLQ